MIKWCKKRKKYLIAAVLVILIVLLAVAGSSYFYFHDTDNFNDESGEQAEIDMGDDEIRQYFTARKAIQNVGILMLNYGDDAATVRASFYDAETDELLSTGSGELAGGSDTETAVNIDIATSETEDSAELYMVLSVEGSSEQVQICVLEGEYSEQEMTIGGEETNYRIRMSVVYGGSYNYVFWVLTVILMALIVLVFVFPEKWRQPQHLFLILASVTGILFAVVTPAVQECDGPMHLYKSMDTSYGNFLGSFVNLTHGDGEIYVPENIMDMNMTTLTIKGGEGLRYVENLQSQTFSDTKVLMSYDGGVASIVYWPQGIGIFLGRALNLSMYGVILFGKIFNLAAYIALTFLAIRLIPCYKMLFTAVALLPISLFQASSLSQDAMLNGMSFLFIALCFYYAYGEITSLNWKHMIWLGVLLLGMFLGKYVYVCLGLLVFMIPKEKFGGKKAYWKAIIPALAVLVILGGYHLGRNLMDIAALQSTETAGAVTQTQLQYLMSQPGALISVLSNTILYHTNDYLVQLNMLGSLNITLTPILILSMAFIAVVGVVDVNTVSRGIRTRDRFLTVISFVITFVMILLALYIGDSTANSYGATLVEGVQGRYFIMMIPLPFIALGSRKLEHEITYFNSKIAAVTGCMLVYAAFMLIRSYY
ncbi:MAG: DUF2142 domain-containing protein [Clostridiales bacterium]|nr:DUF2142 domain-containing protein [Clostridiales bacterium]